MWYLLAGAIIVLLFTFLSACGIKSGKVKEANDSILPDSNNIYSGNSNTLIPGDSNGHYTTNQAGPLFTKEQIEQKLSRLAKATPPDNLSFGAMCYKVSIPPDTASYVCPVCGERTLYERSETGWHGINNLLDGGISSCRFMIKRVKGVMISLDESQFCGHCSPDVDEPRLCITVQVDDNPSNKTCGVDHLDIQILCEFLEGKDRHIGPHEDEVPLVESLNKISELLGVE